MRPVNHPLRTICHVLHTLHVGGAEILAAEYARRSRGEFEVVFACLDELGQLGSKLRDEGFQVEVIGRRSGFDLWCAYRLARFLRRHRVDLVHAHQYGPFFYSALSRMFRFGTPILFMEHGRDFPDYPRPKRKLANRFLLHRRDRVVAVGQCVRTALIDNEGMPAERIEVVYNGVDLRRYDSERRLRSEVRAELGVAPETKVIMQVARLNRLKDHATALRAVALLKDRCPNIRLVLAGDGEERPAIERLIGELGLAPWVQLLGTRGDVPRLLQGADLFLLSSVTEGIALTLIEAMATGLPVVATNVGGNSEVVVDGQTGRLVPAQCPEKLAQALEGGISDMATRHSLGTAGLRRAHLLFDSEVMHQAFRTLYWSMLGGAPTAPTASADKDGPAESVTKTTSLT